MGLFSSKEIVVVASVAYNMAGDEKDRPDYLKSLVVRNVLSETKDSIADTLRNGYLNGPAMKFRSFYRWANNPDNYDQVGMPTGTLTTAAGLDPSLVSTHIPHDSGQEVWTQVANLGNADPGYWAEQWIMENDRSQLNTEWVADYAEDTGEITIIFQDDTAVAFTPEGFDYSAKYIYAYYTLAHTSPPGPLEEGDLEEIGDDPFPSTDGWTLIEDNTEEVEVELPSGTVTFDRGEWIYQRITYQSNGDESVTEITRTMHLFQDAEVIDDELVYNRSYRIDRQEQVINSYSPLKLFIYKIGSGNAALDSLVNSVDYGKFFPFIPFRIENKFLSETYRPAAYAQVKKAYKKATDSSLDDLIEELKDNEHLGDIDNAYVVFGTSLNTLEPASRRYIYTFMEKLMSSQEGGPLIYQEFLDAVAEQQEVFDEWQEWWTRKNTEDDFHGEEPPRPVLPNLPYNEIRIAGVGDLRNRYDMRIQWKFINSGVGSGLGKPGVKPKDCWIEYMGRDEFTQMIYAPGTNTSNPFIDLIEQARGIGGDFDKIRIYWQRTSNTYTYLDIIGLIHQNYVYGGKSVRIPAREALEDPEESGFIVPMHYDTWKETSLVDTSQMATACVYTVFNCYEIHKQKWYQRGIFKVLFVIAIAIVSVVFTGGAGFGILGSHFSLGSALGFSGMTAAIVGSVVNAMAALILTTMIEKFAAHLGILGQILSAVFMFFVGGIINGFRTGAIAINWGDLLRADNLLKLTNIVARGFTGMLQADTAALQGDMMDFSKKAQQEIEKIQQAYFKEFGYGAGVIDPFMFVDSTNQPIAESSNTFLTRTLMTGSEIVEMSQELLYEFPELSLKLPDAFI